MEIIIELCDFSNPEHRKQIIELTRAYMRDPMGGGEEMSQEVKQTLAEKLANHPCTMIFFARVDSKYVGIATCFINISTFYAKPYFNVHDIAILPEYRGKGIGKKLLEKIIDVGREKGFCKITLEVRHDNINAQKLYKSLGFADTQPPMYFWTKWL